MSTPTSAIAVGSTATRSFGPITRQMLVRYAGASGDFNPMHYDDEFARSAGFPSVFSQGMHQAGLLGTFVSEWLGPANVRRFHVRFREQVWPGDKLTCTGRVVEIRPSDEGPLAVVELTCDREGGGTAISGTATYLAPGAEVGTGEPDA